MIIHSGSSSLNTTCLVLGQLFSRATATAADSNGSFRDRCQVWEMTGNKKSAKETSQVSIKISVWAVSQKKVWRPEYLRCLNIKIEHFALKSSVALLMSPNWFIAQLFCHHTVLSPYCFVTQLFCRPTVLLPNCFVAQLFCHHTVLSPYCFVTILFCRQTNLVQKFQTSSCCSRCSY